MSTIIIAVLFCYFSFLIINGTASGEQVRITNGSDAVLGEIPYIVSLRWLDSHYCGASILSQFYVLTAAHCIFQSNPSVYSIQYGELELDDNTSSIINIEKVVFFVENSTNTLNNEEYKHDIAILKLESPLVFSDFIQPVRLPVYLNETPANSVALLAGWGSNKTQSTSMQHLQKALLKVESDEECELLYSSGTTFNADRNFHICAGDIEQEKAQCSGDSGGPLLIDGVQIGIVSYSFKPCGKVKPGVFTKVSTYTNWINSVIN